MGPDGAHIDTIVAPDAPPDFDDGRYRLEASAENDGRWISVGAIVPFSPGWY